MNKPEIIIYGFILMEITGAFIAFFKTPKEQRFKQPKHENNFKTKAISAVMRKNV